MGTSVKYPLSKLQHKMEQFQGQLKLASKAASRLSPPFVILVASYMLIIIIECTKPFISPNKISTTLWWKGW